MRVDQTEYKISCCCPVVAILLLVLVETWQALALGRDYFLELENWFELLILSLTVCTLSLKAELDSLAIVASVGVCLAWIELIFQFGRIPSLGGTFSIMSVSFPPQGYLIIISFVVSLGIIPSLRESSEQFWAWFFSSSPLLWLSSSSIGTRPMSLLRPCRSHSSSPSSWS